jgi:hypothetical protein
MFDYKKKDELNELEWKCITEIKDKLSVTIDFYERIKLYHLLIDTRNKIEFRNANYLKGADVHHHYPPQQDQPKYY